MNDVLKGILIALVLVYIVSPVDMCPGPVDDIIVLLVTLAKNKGITTHED